MKVLITGVAGFIGGYLSQHCAAVGSTVLGIDVREPAHITATSAFELCDIRDTARMSELLAQFKPDRIFHLAAQSYPTVSLLKPRETFSTNIDGTINLFECVRASASKSLVIVACSSAEYGPIATENLPVKENHPLAPIHPYGVSKAAQDLLALQYFVNYSIPTVRLRIFKTTGPGILGDVCSDLMKRAVEIEMGLRPPVMLAGNLTSRRSILDVRDLVSALWLSAEHCKAGEVYNVGGENCYSVSEVIEAIATQFKLKFAVEQSPELSRSFDEPVISGDNSKFRACCYWQPKITLTQTLQDMYEWWRDRFATAKQDHRLHASA
jgi:GDP-4-dehydro-6-deoxy-D-mannose reductase